MIRQLLTILLLALAALLLPGTCQLDGVLYGTRAQAAGLLRFSVGRRRVSLVLAEYRPGRVYYRCQVVRV